MHVVTCCEPGTLALETRDTPVPAPGEVLVRIRRVGVCGTDYHIFRGTQPYLSYPRVMGHELAGVVEQTDAASGFAPGTPVCIMPYLFCGHCVACAKGKTNCCVNIQVLGVHCDGGLAELLAIDPRYLLDASGLTLDQAAMVEFLAIGYHAVRRAALAAGERVLVVGAGPIGMAVALFAGLKGADVTVLDGNAARAGFCVERLGARAAVPLDADTPTRLAEISGGAFFDAVFDATGNAKAMEKGFGYVAHGGRYVLVSIVAADITFNDPEFHKRETTLLGSRNATLDDFAAVIALIREGRVPTAAMHTHSAPLADLPGVIERWMAPDAGVIKAIVEI
ncbi:zinc-binding alcohol dehydrogenase family protein [Sphingomonas sp. NFR15]|uniref:zinc-binding alcohol dehydrogenase family protein n=1 Tax=Sphingomonas sp. NFR15 TaxID=1566282 RepID=UPI000887F4C1|nr:zinc-binding alcohol dehydrogenase family protein [Sphingomonas sp. NFR15]SDA30143.1 2-desacetyl-2-hydroxyethyl bacteriochlorophyllide A dehydrogenase [Sphingomonas sp. NFR15]